MAADGWRVAFRARQEQERSLSTEEILGFLRDLEQKDDLPVQRCLDIVMQSTADTCSITREKPYRYFHVHRTRNALVMRVSSDEHELEFTIPYSKVG